MRRELWRRSNPAQRRNEMMACIKNLKLIVEMRGDCAMSSTLPAHPTHVRKPRPVTLQSTSVKTSMGVVWVIPSARIQGNYFAIALSLSLRGHLVQ